MRDDRVTGCCVHVSTSESECGLKLRRASIEAGLEPLVVQRSVPSAVQHEEQIVAGLQNPAKPALKAGNPRLVVVLRRSEEHTSELQSRPHLVCRLLLEKKTNDF